MPRATHIRGLPVAAVAGQRQAMQRAKVQAATVPVLVTAEVGAVATSLGANITLLDSRLEELGLRVDALEEP